MQGDRGHDAAIRLVRESESDLEDQFLRRGQSGTFAQISTLNGIYHEQRD